MKVTKHVFSCGTIIYCNEHGEHHREDGPAEIWPNGTKFWWLDGNCHREDGPAEIWPDGYKRYYLNGEPYEYEEWLDRVTNPIMHKWKEFSNGKNT